MRRKTMMAAAAVLALAAGGAGVATAVGAGGDPGESATGAGADKAKAAALSITGGGKANQVERDTENGAVWEVEVTKPNGKTVDVRLDGSFNKVAVEGDREVEGKDDAGEQADDHGANEAAEHGAETNDD